MPARSIRSIAIIDPLGDTGIGSYVHELAEGLVANHREVTVYTNGRALITRYALTRHHNVFPVLGSVLFRQQAALRPAHEGTATTLREAEVAGMQRSGAEPQGAKHASPIVSRAHSWFLAWELALHLRRRRYDLVWTQWPEPVYGGRFHRLCRRLGLRLAHTVHNILPHEEAAGDKAICEGIYRNSEWLLVHSQETRKEMMELFPECGPRVIVARHGLYTMYPQPSDGTSELRRKLAIPEGKAVMLFFGGIRPYKNIDAALLAMADDRCKETVLVVAGKESGYAGLIHGQRLGRTRRMAAELGIAERVILIERPSDLQQTAELMVAADILLLPYRKSYGSGLLLLGMTFGKHIVATGTGGSEEYLAAYPRHTLLKGSEASHVAAGIEQAVKAIAQPAPVPAAVLEVLRWSHITQELLENMEGQLDRLENTE